MTSQNTPAWRNDDRKALSSVRFFCVGPIRK